MSFADEGRQMALKFRNLLFKKYGGYRFVRPAEYGSNLQKIFCLAIGDKRCDGIVCISADDLSVLVLTMKNDGHDANAWLEQAAKRSRRDLGPGPKSMASITSIERKYRYSYADLGFAKSDTIEWITFARPGIEKALECNLVDPEVEDKIDECLALNNGRET